MNQLAESSLAATGENTTTYGMQYIFCMEAMFSDYEVEPELDPIIEFKAAYDQDTIYKNHEMQHNEAAKLHKLMQKTEL